MRIAALLLALLLSGCSGGLTQLSDQALSTVTDGVTGSVSYIADSSAIKELAVHKTLQNRDKMVRDAHKDSGMSVGWQAMQETVFYPGMADPITVTRYLPTISYNEQAEFEQVLPTRPSEHPGWRVAERIGVAAINGTVIGMGINATRDVLQSAVNSAGHNSDSSSIVNDSSTGPVDSSNNSDNSDSSNNSDNSIGPVDNSIGPVDNSIGPVDNSDNRIDNSVGPVDNSMGIIPEVAP